MDYYDKVQASARVIREQASELPTVGIILGSGLGDFVHRLERSTALPYDMLPHWPATGISDHEGRLYLGRLKGRALAVLAGRVHLYEGHDAGTVAFGVRALGVLGVRTLVLTNAAGGINPGLMTGALMLIDDHINLTGQSPLTGSNDERFGTRFPDMTEAYSPRLRRLADETARALGQALPHGVYAGLPGPSYETPAEIRYLRTIGADAVGMSTVSEAVAARHMGLEILGLSCISNRASDVRSAPVTHEEVLTVTRRVRGQFAALLEGIIERL